jgi:hypothetical protein
MTDAKRPTAEEIRRLATDLADAFIAKCGGRVTELDLARVLEAEIDMIRATVPPEIAPKLIAKLRANWQDLLPSRN